jgi:hypothetical protein
MAVVLDHDLIAEETAGVVSWCSSNQRSAWRALSPVVSPLMSVLVWFTCLLILESVNCRLIVIHGIVSGDEGEVTWAREWWRAFGAGRLQREVNVQVLSATITRGRISAMSRVDAVNLSVHAVVTVEIHLRAHFLTLLVHLLPELIDARLSSLLASLLQFLVGGAFHEDIDVALNFLCG